MLRHFNQVLRERWTKQFGLAISATKIRAIEAVNRTYSASTNATSRSRTATSKPNCSVMQSLSNICFSALFAASCVIGSSAALAQSGDSKPPDKATQPQPPTAADAEAQRRTDEFAEAARAVSGPAGNAECVWLGRRVVGLLWRDDMDTAFRHLDLYDRFGCPGPHIQSAFRCVVRQGNIDPKNQQSLNTRVHACWLNPSSTNTAAAGPAASTAQAGTPPGGTPSAAAPAPGAQPAPPAAAQPPAAAKPPGTPSR